MRVTPSSRRDSGSRERKEEKEQLVWRVTELQYANQIKVCKDSFSLSFFSRNTLRKTKGIRWRETALRSPPERSSTSKPANRATAPDARPIYPAPISSTATRTANCC